MFVLSTRRVLALAGLASVLSGPLQAAEPLQNTVQPSVGRFEFVPLMRKEILAFRTIERGTSVPYGLTDYCARTPQPEACQPRGDTTVERMMITSQREAELVEASKLVTLCSYKTDMEMHGVSEQWDNPLEDMLAGKPCEMDCENGALAQQEFLIGKGWSSSTLLVTLVYDKHDVEKKNGHAVLVARTSEGDYALDIQYGLMTPEFAAEKFVFAGWQNPQNPQKWDDISYKPHKVDFNFSALDLAEPVQQNDVFAVHAGEVVR